jgi:tRNA A-37 threonylcarbamoyl transferase component Bud32
MKDIEELITNSKKYENTIIQKRFKSKKNTVCSVLLNNKPCVIKWYAPGYKKNMQNEYTILKKGHNQLNIPTIIEKDTEHNVLVLNYLRGDNLCDLLHYEKTTLDEKKRVLACLAEWYANFHHFFNTNSTYSIHGDSILRNFLYADTMYGVDFEESRVGERQEDIAGIAVSLLTTYPMFTKEKFYLCRCFISHYEKAFGEKVVLISKDISYKLLNNIQYRPDDEQLFTSFVKHIRKYGLYF